MSSINKTESGGRRFRIKGEWGKLDAVVDADCNIISSECEILDPGEPEKKPASPGCSGCKKLSPLEKFRGAIKLNKAIDGHTDVSTEIIEQRKAICQSCEHNDIGRCVSCGCIIWAKIRFLTEACPDKKWGAES